MQADFSPEKVVVTARVPQYKSFANFSDQNEKETESRK
jgi:hypothetical protein